MKKSPQIYTLDLQFQNCPNAIASYLIPYLRDDSRDARRSRYVLLTVDHPRETEDLLSLILDPVAVVDKQREIFLIENVRVHLDEVKDLGRFIEFEAVYRVGLDDDQKEVERVQELIERFEIDEDALVSVSYADLMANAHWL